MHKLVIFFKLLAQCGPLMPPGGVPVRRFEIKLDGYFVSHCKASSSCVLCCVELQDGCNMFCFITCWARFQFAANFTLVCICFLY